MAANRPEHPALNWSDLDRRAVDTVRVLAMDAVEKAGNGHPGTAMSLAPAAYLLFNRVMRHDPTDPDWPGRDRFVLSAGHSSLTLYIQLYLSGYGLALDDLKSLRQWGSLTPGHPEHGHTPGVETTTGPLGQGLANAVGMAMAARRERGLFDPEPAAGESAFDHHIWCIASDGDIEEGISHEASALAGHQQLGNLMVIYDDNEISIEDDTRIAKSEDVAARYAAYGWHVQTVDWRTGDATGRLPRGRRGALPGAAGRQGRDRPPVVHLAAHHHRLAGAEQAEHRQDPRLGARRRRGRRHQGAARLRPGADFAVADEVLAHAREVVEPGRAGARGMGRRRTTRGPQANPERKALLRPAGHPYAARRAGPRRCRPGRRTPRGSPPGPPPARCSRRSPRCCRSCGAARPTWRRATTPR